MLLALSGRACAAPPDAAVIRVDPALGRDRPAADAVATLQAALDRVAAIRARRPAAAIAIELAPGLHRLARPLMVGPEHGGTVDAPLVIRGAAGGQTHLTGSVPLEPLAQPLPPAIAARLPPAARDHVRLYRLPPAALERPTIQETSVLNERPATVALEVYDAQGALVPARWPDEGWAHTAAGSAEARFTVDEARLARWRDEPDLWAEGFWRWDWLFEAFPVSGRIDVAARRVALPRRPYEGVLAGARFRISHALSELDRPGEWWRDAAHGLLVAWPRDAGGRLEVAVATGLLAVRGAAHVRLDELVLDHARGDLLTVQASHDVTLRGSTLAWAAGRGAVFTASTDGGVEGCDLHGLGGGGVDLEGGDRPSLRPGALFVRDSRLSDYARLVLTQRAGVTAEGVGALIQGNLFRDAGAPGVVLHGNDHRVLGNEFTRLLGGITDNGAIYSGRDWTARGTLIEGNYLHDIRADPGFETKGVYLDDEASGFAIRRNLFVRVEQPVFIGGGRDNVVAENLFVASSPAIHVDSRGETWAAGAIADPESELRAAFRAMPTGSPIWLRRYPRLAGLLDDEPAVGKDNRLTGNGFVLSTPFDFSDGGQRARQQVDGNSGPEGIRSAAGHDLAALAAGSRDPQAFADLVDAAGRPVGLALPGLPAGLRP